MTGSQQDQAERERNRSAADAFLALRDAAVRQAPHPARTSPASRGIPPFQRLLERRLAVPMMRHSPATTRAAWSRLNGGADLCPQRRLATPCTGEQLQVDPNEVVGSRLLDLGAWERHVTALLLDTPGDGDVFCDMGARIGCHTVLAVRLVGRGGRVVAIEPSPTALRGLRHDVAPNGLTILRVVPAAVAAERGRVALDAPGVVDATDLAARFGAARFRARAIASACDLEFRAPEPPHDPPLPITAQTDALFSRRPRAGAR